MPFPALLLYYKHGQASSYGMDRILEIIAQLGNTVMNVTLLWLQKQPGRKMISSNGRDLYSWQSASPSAAVAGDPCWQGYAPTENMQSLHVD